MNYIVYAFKIYIFLQSCIIQISNEMSHFSFSNNFIYSNCFFSRLNTYRGSETSGSGLGGVIYCYNLPIKARLLDCYFYNCSASNNGGTIYFNCNKDGSGIDIENSCIEQCFSSNYQFAFIRLFPTSMCKMNYITIIKCNTKTSGYTCLYLRDSNINLSNFNSTNNINKRDSSFTILNPTSFRGIHLSIIKNKVSEYNSISFEGKTDNKLLYSNIIENDSPQQMGVISNMLGTNNFENCIFKNNKNTLFYVKYGLINLFNCTIEHGGSIYSGTISTYFVSLTITNTYKIFHLNTYNCIALETINIKIYSNHQKILIYFGLKFFLFLS